MSESTSPPMSSPEVPSPEVPSPEASSPEAPDSTQPLAAPADVRAADVRAADVQAADVQATDATRMALAAARSLCATQQIPAACLLMVATPIGNLADVGLRTLALLQRCDVVAAEDTRAAQRLLRAWGLSLPVLRADRHREQAAAQQVLQHLQAGRRVAFVSDAGTPAIRDPGAALARAARAAGHAVLALPGPSAVTTALSACGLELDEGYVFAGYVPATQGQRADFYTRQLGSARAVVCFETPHRIHASLAVLGELAPKRRLVLAKELTKQFETFVEGSAQELLAWLDAEPRHAQGEFVLILAPAPADAGAALPEQALQWASRLARELPASRACALVAEMTGADRRALYRWLLDQPGRGDDACTT